MVKIFLRKPRREKQLKERKVSRRIFQRAPNSISTFDTYGEDDLQFCLSCNHKPMPQLTESTTSATNNSDGTQSYVIEGRNDVNDPYGTFSTQSEFDNELDRNCREFDSFGNDSISKNNESVFSKDIENNESFRTSDNTAYSFSHHTEDIMYHAPTQSTYSRSIDDTQNISYQTHEENYSSTVPNSDFKDWVHAKSKNLPFDISCNHLLCEQMEIMTNFFQTKIPDEVEDKNCDALASMTENMIDINRCEIETQDSTTVDSQIEIVDNSINQSLSQMDHESVVDSREATKLTDRNIVVVISNEISEISLRSDSTTENTSENSDKVKNENNHSSNVSDSILRSKEVVKRETSTVKHANSRKNTLPDNMNDDKLEDKCSNSMRRASTNTKDPTNELSSLNSELYKLNPIVSKQHRSLLSSTSYQESKSFQEEFVMEKQDDSQKVNEETQLNEKNLVELTPKMIPTYLENLPLRTSDNIAKLKEKEPFRVTTTNITASPPTANPKSRFYSKGNPKKESVKPKRTEECKIATTPTTSTIQSPSKHSRGSSKSLRSAEIASALPQHIPQKKEPPHVPHKKDTKVTPDETKINTRKDSKEKSPYHKWSDFVPNELNKQKKSRLNFVSSNKSKVSKPMKQQKNVNVKQCKKLEKKVKKMNGLKTSKK